jgi:hypothetical protein
METFKGTKLGLMVQAKAWMHKHLRASNHMYRLRLLRENLIGNDNHEITMAWVLF